MKCIRLLPLVILLSFASCDKQKIDWDIHMDAKSKRPYDTYLARQSLHSFFPGAEVKDLLRSYRFGNMDDGMMYNYQGTSLMILTGMAFNISDKEWSKLKLFVKSGNELVIFASSFDSKVLNSFGLFKDHGQEQEYINDQKQLKLNQHVLSLASVPMVKYGYSGRDIQGYFYNPHAQIIPKIYPALDTSSQDAADDKEHTGSDQPATLNDNEEDSYLMADTISYMNDKPNCIRIAMGRGHIMLHAAPLVTSNYFLLQDGNINYLGGIWSALPADINRIYWDDYMIHSGVESSSSALWKYPATRYGILLAILVAATYILLHLRRKQRIIAIVPPLKNESVSFVETVGRLYYNKRDNTNLAEKMIQQFLEWVRMTYHINTSQLNEEFLVQLKLKSGQPEEDVNGLVKLIYNIRKRDVEVTDVFLHKLYNRIQNFYKNHRK